MNFLELIEHTREIIKIAVEQHSPTAVYCSWGKDALVVTDIARRMYRKIQIVTILTPMKPVETRELMMYHSANLNLNVDVYESDQVPIDGLWLTDPKRCCDIFKVEPRDRSMIELDLKSWITGVRKDEGPTREEFQEIEEYKDGMMKFNPILLWSEADVWRYLAVRRLMAHPYYELGARSIGCKCCTNFNVDIKGPERAGRWDGTEKAGKECGFHDICQRLRGTNIEGSQAIQQPWIS